MKNIYILLLLLLTTSCTTNMGNLSLVSTREINMGSYYTKIANQVKGEDVLHIIIFIPNRTTPLTIENALNDALNKYSADLMTNCKITQTSFYIPYLYGQNRLTITGDLWRDSNYSLLDSGSNQLLFAFENGELKPVKEVILN